MHATLHRLADTDFPRLQRKALTTLQVNVGYRCNQQCVHCHVNAGPNRKEEMAAETVDLVVRFMEASGVKTLDITGGAPELNPHFRRLVVAASRLGVHVIDRCNLTITEQPGQEDLVDFLATNRIEVIASLPCYLEENVDRQRGKHVFAASLRALEKLNAAGYGRLGTGLDLNLVYNPIGPTLPPPQEGLEDAYRRELGERYGIVFNRLFTLANMPIQRFGSTLVSKAQFEPYMRLLKSAHRDENLESVMCRTMMSVDWQGYVYDCDFNQMLGLPLRINGYQKRHLADLMGVNVEGLPIEVADHCYGCTAGQGSSCGGALSA
jgi:radical SAM/Cys-rich protein